MGAGYVCGGQTASGSALGSPGVATTPATDYYHSLACTKSQGDNMCFEKCLREEWEKPRPFYSIVPGVGTQCQQYDEDVNRRCRNQCGLK